jgi:hypothetical protein
MIISMRNKKLLALAVLFVVLVVGAILLFFPASRLQVIGNVSSRDLADAKKFAHHQIWQDVFPNFSLSSITHLLPAINTRWHMRLVRVEAKPDGNIEVTITVRKVAWRYVSYTLKREGKGWKIVTMNAHN